MVAGSAQKVAGTIRTFSRFSEWSFSRTARSRAAQERRFIDWTGEIVVERRLHITLEHLHRQNDLAAPTGEQTFVHGQLDAMRRFVGVRLAEKDHIRPGERIEKSVKG